MSRPAVEVADILRAQGDRFLDRYETSFSSQQLKAFRAVLNCRTATLGGHLDACTQCGHQAISYNSCRNRHCPKCQTQARERWLAARQSEVLPTSYFHVVFTVPHELCRRLLAVPVSSPEANSPTAASETWHCPRCGSAMVLVQKLSASELRPRCASFDNS